MRFLACRIALKELVPNALKESAFMCKAVKSVETGPCKSVNEYFASKNQVLLEKHFFSDAGKLRLSVSDSIASQEA